MSPARPIVWCIDSPGFGGAERDLLRVIGMIRDVWPEQSVAHGTPMAPQLRDALAERDVPLEPFQAGSRVSSLGTAWRSSGRLIQAHRGALWVVWCHHFDACRWLQARLASGRERFLLAERSMAWDEGVFARSRLTRPLKRRTVAAAGAVAVPGAVQAAYYPKLFGVRPDKVRFVPNSRSIRAWADAAQRARDDRPATRRARGLPTDAFVISAIGRLDMNKGPDVLIHAVAEARRTRADLFLCLVGEGGARPALERLAAERLPGAHAFAGERGDVADYLGASDAFVLPSRFEGLSGALLEAMAAKVNVIASDIPPNRELVQDEQTGLLVGVGDPHALACAILRIAASPDEARRWREVAFSKVSHGYDEAVERREWLTLLDSISRGRVP